MRGGRKSERLREREIDREREDQSGWRRQRPDQVGLGVEWSGLVVNGDQIDDRWWWPDQSVMSRKPKESTHDALLMEQKLNC